MSLEVPSAFIESFGQDVLQLAQQEDTRLLGAVRIKMLGPGQGKSHWFEAIGKVAMRLITSRHADTPLDDTPHQASRALLADFAFADLVDDFDRTRIKYDPTAPYARNARKAAGRQMDQTVIDALNGDAFRAKSGTEKTSGSNDTFDTTNRRITSAAGLIIDDLIAAKELLDRLEAPEDDRFMVIDSFGLADLLGTTEVSSADFNTIRALVLGQLDTFLGFKFIRSQLISGAGATGTKTGLAFQKDGLGLAIGIPPEVSIDIRHDKLNSVQVLAKLQLGAVRTDDDRVLEMVYTD